MSYLMSTGTFRTVKGIFQEVVSKLPHNPGVHALWLARNAVSRDVIVRKHAYGMESATAKRCF